MGSELENSETTIANVDRIQSICSNLTKQVVDGRPGISPEDLSWIKKSKSDYQQKLEGVVDLSVRQNASINFELLDALEATFDYLNRTDPKKAADRQKQGSEYARLGAKANIEFLDFFIKIREGFKLSNQDVLDIYYQIFEKDGLAKEFTVKGLRNFPSGCLGSIVAYLYLDSKKPDWYYHVPSVEQDASHAVDLISKSDNLTHYITVKGGGKAGKVLLKNITEEKDLKSLLEKITLSRKSDHKIESQLDAINKIFEFVNNENRQGRKSKAFFMEVPTKWS